MFLGFITLLTALVISAVAIYYSVAGLAAIFASAVIPIVIMGVSLEVGKLVTAVWLHRYWKIATWWLKAYLSLAVIVLMFITSMGIFGFLSKAHIEQTATVGNNSLQVELIDQRIQREQKRIADADLVVSQLDRAVQVLLDNDRIRGPNGAIAVRESQKDERASLNEIISDAQNNVAKLQDEKLVLEKEQVAIEAEVGPIKYIAEFIYGETADKNMLEEAVRWVIVILIFVFDPLAVLLLIASQYTFEYHRRLRDDDSGDRLRPAGPLTGEKQDDILVEEINTDADATVRDMGTENAVSDDDQTGNGVEQVEVQSNGPTPDELARPYSEVDKPTDEEIVQALDHVYDEKLVEPVDENQINRIQELVKDVVVEEPVEKKDTSSKTVESTEQFRLTEEQLNELEQSEEWQKAKSGWKIDHPDLSLKFFKQLYLEGKINKLPWEDYLVEKKPYMMKEDNQQVRKITKQSLLNSAKPVDGYIQNEEQKEKGLWKRIRRDNE